MSRNQETLGHCIAGNDQLCWSLVWDERSFESDLTKLKMLVIVMVQPSGLESLKTPDGQIHSEKKGTETVPFFF